MALAAKVEAIVMKLPKRFELTDVLRQTPEVVERHVGVPNLRASIRDALDRLVQRDVIKDLGDDLYERTVGDAGVVGLDWPLKPGTVTTRRELAEMLGQAGPAGLQRGMFKPAGGKRFSDHILLFHDPFNNPYGDEIVGDTILYVGEGHAKLGDQSLTRNNRHLANQLEHGYQAHFFEQVSQGSSEVRYHGPVLARDVRRVYRDEEKRSVLQFELVRVDTSVGRDQLGSAYARALLNMNDDPRAHGLEPRPTRKSTVEKLVRDRAFAQLVLAAYQYVCAVCGDALQHEGKTELEAAHIIPVADRGPDRVQNGISLCKRHHWAFDNGIFTLTKDLAVQILMTERDPHGELSDGERVRIPDKERLHPHEFYVQRHRQKWRRTPA